MNGSSQTSARNASHDPSVVVCSSCQQVVSDGITIIDNCVCGAVVHVDPPCFGQCTSCFQSLCITCRQDGMHSCLDIRGSAREDDSDELGSDYASTSASEAIESVAAARTDARAAADTGACPKRAAKREHILPAEGVLVSRRWRTVHKKSADGLRTACGILAPEVAYESIESGTFEELDLCRRPGCFDKS